MPLLPLPEGLEISALSQTADGLLIRVSSNRTSCPCPVCSTPSEAVHSFYRRHPQDLPCAGQRIQILLSVHKFFCRVPTCPRKVFTERLPELLRPHSRFTTRVRTLIQAMGLAFNGQGGARLAKQCGIQLSRVTLLRSLSRLVDASKAHVRAVGIDDFAWKRGKRYGTVIIDLENHEILDLLPDREADSVQKWLAAYPDIEIVSRDRGGASADGAARGAPQAEQVADRWHLCKNLGDAVEQAVLRLRLRVPARPSETAEPSKGSGSGEEGLSNPAESCSEPAQTARVQALLQRKRELADQILTLRASGQSIHAITSQLEVARNTVRRYLRLDGVVELAPRPRSACLLDPHADYLQERFKQGETNARRLFEELQSRGYRGSETTVRNFVARLRKDLPGLARPPRRTSEGRTGAPASSPRDIRWVLTRREEELEPEERADRLRLLEQSPEAHLLFHLLQDFLQMVRLRQSERLDSWMQTARSSGIKELISFANGIERDYTAVRAGLRLSWSQGPVEGTVNKIKTHKRLMYGRASFKLLRQKLLHQKVT
jgi:transposase